MKKKSREKERGKAEEERDWNSALKGLEEMHLMQGETPGGLLYCALEGDHPDALSATATVVVPVRDGDTGKKHSVRLPLGVEN